MPSEWKSRPKDASWWDVWAGGMRMRQREQRSECVAALQDMHAITDGVGIIQSNRDFIKAIAIDTAMSSASVECIP